MLAFTTKECTSGVVGPGPFKNVRRLPECGSSHYGTSCSAGQSSHIMIECFAFFIFLFGTSGVGRRRGSFQRVKGSPRLELYVYYEWLEGRSFTKNFQGTGGVFYQVCWFCRSHRD